MATISHTIFFNCIFFLNENLWISSKISLKYVFHGLIDSMSALVQIMAWRRSGDKPLSEPMMVSLLTYYMRHSASMNDTQSQQSTNRVRNFFEYSQWLSWIRLAFFTVIYRWNLFCCFSGHQFVDSEIIKDKLEPGIWYVHYDWCAMKYLWMSTWKTFMV